MQQYGRWSPAESCPARPCIAAAVSFLFGTLPFFSPLSDSGCVPCDHHQHGRIHYICLLAHTNIAIIQAQTNQKFEHANAFHSQVHRQPNLILRRFTHQCFICNYALPPHTARQVSAVFLIWTHLFQGINLSKFHLYLS